MFYIARLLKGKLVLDLKPASQEENDMLQHSLLISLEEKQSKEDSAAAAAPTNAPARGSVFDAASDALPGGSGESPAGVPNVSGNAQAEEPVAVPEGVHGGARPGIPTNALAGSRDGSSDGFPGSVPGASGGIPLGVPGRPPGAARESATDASRGAASSVLESILDSVHNLIWVMDRQNRFIYCNKACAAFWGTDCGSLLETQLDAVLLPTEAEFLLENAAQVLEKGRELYLETTLHNYENSVRWMVIIVTPIFNKQNEIFGVTFTACDVTARKHNEEELKYFSMHDHLTGLYNRVYFEEEIRRLSAERHYPVSIVVCDVDGLKFVNDIMGHGQGDELLKTVAEILKKPFRSSDVVARIGGDEFAVILPSTDEKVVAKIANRLQRVLEQDGRGRGGIPLGLSIGFATGDNVSGGIMEVLKQADGNMYKNKFARREIAKKEMIDYMLSVLPEKDFRDEKYEDRLRRLTLLLGKAIGLPLEDLRYLLQLARVHEIGKFGIDEAILLKKGELDESEWAEIKRHPEIGYRIAQSSEELAPLADYILQHHENWNGEGYPQGLRGKEIHLYSRILAIIGAYEAMITPRPYREALSPEEAIRELEKNSGIQFDPRLANIFISLLENTKNEDIV